MSHRSYSNKRIATPSLLLILNISEGRDNLFKKRIAALLEAKEGLEEGLEEGLLGGPSNIVALCKISNQPLNDRNILAHFCPHLIATDDTKNIASTIFAKIRKKSDQSFLTKGSLSLPTQMNFPVTERGGGRFFRKNLCCSFPYILRIGKSPLSPFSGIFGHFFGFFSKLVSPIDFIVFPLA